MTYSPYFDSKKSLKLFGLIDNFNLIKNLYITKKLPKVLMLTGKKGSGKSTLINHLMFYIFDQKNYQEKENVLKTDSAFYNQFINNIFSNIIYLSGSNFKNIKIDDIRNLKIQISKTSISEKPRFIIFDDVELFNINSLNALLKVIEEPSKNNFFLLINNKSKPLIETIKSRCLDVQIILNEQKRLDIIKSLITRFEINPVIDPLTSKLTPGNFIIFNYIFENNKISPDSEYLKNFNILLDLYKKNKEVIYIDMMIFLTDSYLNKLKNNNSFNNEKILEYKTFIYENINKFFLYNLNPNSLLNTINSKIND
jgi:DNA polymerase III subunit delta'|tara:strand:+ start:578 stop:1510 length:933 start_codon:yes stop_codon:yes gene_type:complete